MKTCDFCKKEYQPKKKNPRNRFCSVRCRDKFYNEIRKKEKIDFKCDYCKQSFVPKVNNPRFKFCSNKCKIKDQKEKSQQQEKSKIKPDIIECEHCKKPFEPKTNKPKHKFCSRSCSEKGNQLTNCIVCNKELIKKQQKKYCSYKCQEEHKEKKFQLDEQGNLLGKKCSKCNEYKEKALFSRSKNHKYGIKPACKACSSELGGYKTVELIFNEHGEMTAKECRGCGEIKPLEEYAIHTNGYGGRHPHCKTCQIKPKSVMHKVVLKDGVLVERQCNYCNKIKPIDAFFNTTAGFQGKSAHCISCHAYNARKITLMRQYEHYMKRSKRKFVEKLHGTALVWNRNKIIKKSCSACKEIKIIDDFNFAYEGWGGKLAKCKPCYEQYIYRFEHSEWRKQNRAQRQARKKLLPDDLDNWTEILKRFDYRCALTGSKKFSLEHFIPLHTGHGGTYEANVYPLERKLNYSKSGQNPFKWIETPYAQERINMAKWNDLIKYLADLNGLTPDEFKDYVNWCFDNPRSIKELKKNRTPSIELWSQSRTLF